MNIPGGSLARDFERAHTWWGHLIDDAERRHGIPPRLLYATWSRETNLGRHWRTAPPAVFPPGPTDDDLTYFIRHPGDNGHGRGGGQVDDRSHAIPDDWATNIEWQVERSAEILADCLGAENGDIVRAANRYNSGQPHTARTTGKDYGPDVAERHAFLLAHHPPSATRPKEISMLIGYNTSNVGLFWDGEKVSYISGPDKDALLKTRDGGPGVPEFGVLSDDFWRSRGAPDEVIALTKP